METVWTEKYRPRKVDDVVGCEAHKVRIKNYMKSPRTMQQCMIFSGPAGTGKTTMAYAMAHELFGDNLSANFLELNASDERGIDVVRGKIRSFAKTAAINSPIKIVFLDEADALTSEAQAALRRTMEKYAHRCKFILSCNYSNKLMKPLWSRSAKFRFIPPSPGEVMVLVERVVLGENLDITDDAKVLIAKRCEFVPRDTVIYLQECYAQAGDSQITVEIVRTVQPNSLTWNTVVDAVKLAIKGDVGVAAKNLDNMVMAGTTYPLVLETMLKAVQKSGDKFLNINKIIQHMALVDANIQNGGSPLIQMASLLATIQAEYNPDLMNKLGKKE